MGSLMISKGSAIVGLVIGVFASSLFPMYMLTHGEVHSFSTLMLLFMLGFIVGLPTAIACMLSLIFTSGSTTRTSSVEGDVSRIRQSAEFDSIKSNLKT